MESANTHHHLQDQLVGSSASSLATSTPSGYGLGFTSPSFLNSNCFSSYPSETKQQQQESSAVSSQIYMAPDLGLINWGNNGGNNHDCEQESRIKEELAEHYYRKYSEILSSSLQSTNNELSLRNEEQAHDDLQANDVATKFLLKSFSYGNLMNKIHLSPAAPDHSFYSNTRGFGQIFPTNQGSLDMNLEALDLLASSRFGENQIGILRDGFSNYGFDHHAQQSHQIPFYASNNKMKEVFSFLHSKVSSASSNAVVDQQAKRNSNKMEPKSLNQNAPKKSRLEARSSCPPFKVRKEKLGDRIAALQQLVAPFGKTDTASVLMEAIGYIKFLQNQVETLSVPYMKASRNKPNRVTKGGFAENENEEQKRDLKSRGLCLVPLSCLSYITDGGGAAVWPQPHFGGAA